MRILDPVLVPDISLWVDHIKAKEFEEGGCQSVIAGLYSQTVNSKKVLRPVCRNQCLEVAANSHMVLQAYYWDDITLDPVAQANWVADIIAAERLPITYVWGDLEQWWTNWTLYYAARNRLIPWALVPHAPAANISSHMALFMQTLHSRFPACGVYTNNGFVASWALGMNKWLPLYQSWVAEYAHEPQAVTTMTWEQLKEQWLPDYDVELALGQSPNMAVGHQFTGDLIKLPGSYDAYGRELPLDVSVFSRKFIDGLKAGAVPVPVPTPGPAPAPLYSAYQVNAGVNPNVHTQSNSTSPVVGYILAGTIVSIDTFANDYAHMQPEGAFASGGWICAAYLTKK